MTYISMSISYSKFAKENIDRLFQKSNLQHATKKFLSNRERNNNIEVYHYYKIKGALAQYLLFYLTMTFHLKKAFNHNFITNCIQQLIFTKILIDLLDHHWLKLSKSKHMIPPPHTHQVLYSYITMLVGNVVCSPLSF